MAKAKKKLLSEISQQKRIQQNKKSLNPFEVHINRDKQNVLGKKSKADRGLPGVSRAKAIKKRKETLLQEYKLKNKDNLFFDKRIGEKNVIMNEEDKALARFAAERMKAYKKKNIYNLNDEEILTHKGQTLEEIEKFDDPKSDDEYSDDENITGKLDNKFVGEAHFGGGVLSKSESGKSRKDLIEELIIESKKRKAEKQKIREQTIDLTEKLDSEWRDLLPIVSAANKDTDETIVKIKADDYDIAVRELKFEAKGIPSDKLKSEEEIVKEEKERLEALEADRVARMKGLVNHLHNNEIKHKSADDLDDAVNTHENEQLVISNKLNGNIKKQKKAENSNGNKLDENSTEEISELESSEEDNLSDLKETDSSSEEENEKQEIRDDLLKRKEIMESARKELPYTYKVPESFEELQEFLQNYSADYQSVIIDRIIKCNHWSLSNTNKEKLSNLFLFLLQHLNDNATEDNVENVIKCFQIIDRLSPSLYDLAHLNPINAKAVIQAIIKEKYEEFKKNKKKYPGLDTLIFFKLVSLIFPTSDFRHPITTPCLIFMSQILFRCRIKNKTDISKGLFICILILEINLDIDPNSVFMTVSDLINGPLDDDFKIRALLTAINLLREFKNHLEELEAVYSIFEPILKLLKVNSFDKYPLNVKKYIKQLRRDLKELKNKKLEYIMIEKKKPKPLRLYEPRIETVYDAKKHKSMSKDKAERGKLLHKYKKEMKGAIREIRRDRAFIAKLQIKEQIKSDKERKRKVKEIFGDAAMQQGELKKLKRKK
ncbi:Nucleolar protein 14 like protein [Eufriesea mexicana]|uniref:Nucleolar protein 14 like protein n=1 Tax=Eufriesea mexicana TaxID=516756 RepID=A0A310S8X3_9HYME|nr:Nucleolar protein 14 like protein [Eufriesea mexicana]